MPAPLVIQVPGVTTDLTKPFLRPDGLLGNDVNNGVRFLFDFGGAPGYSGGAVAPANGAVIKNLAGLGDGAMAIGGASVLAMAGNGVDLTGVVAKPTGVQAPASVSADLWTAYGGAAQRYLICGYVRLPAKADWNVNASLCSIFSLSDQGSGYSGGPDAVMIGMTGSNPANGMTARRQTAAATIETAKNLVPVDADFGGLAQWAFWKSAAGTGFRIKTANGVLIATSAGVADNTQDFSALKPTWGAPLPFTAVYGGFKGLRLFRGFIENLARSGHDPVTQLDADWTRTVARGVFG